MIGAVFLLGIVVALVFYSQQDMQRAEDAKTVHSTELIPMDSIAILPFANLTTAVETGFFAEGLAEDIIDNLAQNKGLKVASRSASFQFKEYGQDPSIIGENLKVAYLLQGSVRRQGETLRITVQLIRTDNGFHVWRSIMRENLQMDLRCKPRSQPTSHILLKANCVSIFSRTLI